MDDNERSLHQARELKTIQLDHSLVLFVRLVMDRCHVNEHNIYNQIGVVAINFTGVLSLQIQKESLYIFTLACG